MNKTVRLGTRKTYRGRAYSIYCSIKLSEDGRLSISGVEGPTPSGNCIGGCGQIGMHLRNEQHEIQLAPGWTRDMLARFFDVWERWHLNDMKAGTPAQMAELEKHTFKHEYGSHYDWACKLLEEAGLNPDKGYRYGTAWLREDVPEDVIAFLQSLPDTDKTPAWV